ncbi:caprin-1-like isoform X2 [Oncorhynchus keta]|uniref:caprin-1-like isoform X2 n=1 Tax=Oncorhynchus keta TaxID=8018 RepID=UPI0015FA7C6B|nr:caprin-1-like isoform X2 [Oncorhynchus keta]
MPSATVGNNAVQSSSPELGSGTQSEAMKQVLQVIDKKVRNMEKKKGKLDDYQAKKNKGERLNQDQLDALTKFQEVTNNLDFARELQKSFLSLGQEIQKAVKKSARREQLQREETEQRRLKTVLELQFLLDRLGDEQTRQDLKQPAAGSPLLTDADLTALDNFYKLVGPERDYDVRLTDQYDEASLHLWELLEGRDQAVAGTTYKALKETLDKVLLSGYFDRAQTHQNGVCEEEEEEEEEQQSVVHESSGSREQPAEPERTVTQEYTEAIEVEATEFVNRQFIPETTYSITGNDQVEEWTAEVQVVNALQHQSPPQMTPEPHTVNPVSHTPDPVVRKQVVQDLMAQMQGTYNFMQDSMLEFDGHALDPAIVLAQPMKSAQSVVLQHMVHSESRLSQSSSVPESTHVPMVSSTPDGYSSTAPLYQPSHTAEPRPQTDGTDHIQVFNLNAPVPPTNEADSLKQNQFPSGYGQGFSSQAEHSVEEPDIQQDTLQSAVGGFHTQDQVMSVAAGHQVQSSQGPGFGRQGQSFYNSRGAVSRGGPRNPRGMINGYRGSSNGFRGGYDGYRPPFSNTPNNGYGQQAQFSTASRDYPNSTYQREGYQPGYKRGAVQGPRGCSRGRGGLFKPSRGMVTQMVGHQAN